MDQATFLGTIVQARLLQLFYHYCHNLVSGKSFFQDHKAFKDFYQQTESDYDRLAEYLIAELGKKAFSASSVNKVLFKELSDIDIDKMCCCDMYEKALELEADYNKMLTKLDKLGKLGLKNLVGDLAEKSDVRVYMIKQRLHKSESPDDE